MDNVEQWWSSFFPSCLDPVRSRISEYGRRSACNSLLESLRITFWGFGIVDDDEIPTGIMLGGQEYQSGSLGGGSVCNTFPSLPYSPTSFFDGPPQIWEITKSSSELENYNVEKYQNQICICICTIWEWDKTLLWPPDGSLCISSQPSLFTPRYHNELG